MEEVELGRCRLTLGVSRWARRAEGSRSKAEGLGPEQGLKLGPHQGRTRSEQKYCIYSLHVLLLLYNAI